MSHRKKEHTHFRKINQKGNPNLFIESQINLLKDPTVYLSMIAMTVCGGLLTMFNQNLQQSKIGGKNAKPKIS